MTTVMTDGASIGGDVARLGGLVSASAGMAALFARIRRVATSSLPVLVTGETGSGKELVARALHDESPRRARPFLAINCGALAASLVESELFGHVKGAFTGATADKAGVFEAADGGTLFLDEIGELPLELQPRLLRVLEAKAIRRIGGARELAVDVRIIAATHRDLRAMVAAGRFREDLYHRLVILGVHLPPLRARGDDVLVLARSMLAELSGGTMELTADAEAALVEYSWPGNVRELRNVIARAALLSDGQRVDAAALELPVAEVERRGDVAEVAPTSLAARSVCAEPRDEGRGPAPVRLVAPIRAVGDGARGVLAEEAPLRALRSLTLDEERAALVEALAACGNNRSRAARRLGISRSALHERLKRLGVPPRFQAPELRAAV
ncbi:sigma-54 dependent transcriptional regulator [Myxococcota bacterium]|nr:sigma-54 dependent transcriptional regulator [Myxococcota bacterium]